MSSLIVASSRPESGGVIKRKINVSSIYEIIFYDLAFAICIRSCTTRVPEKSLKDLLTCFDVRHLRWEVVVNLNLKASFF